MRHHASGIQASLSMAGSTVIAPGCMEPQRDAGETGDAWVYALGFAGDIRRIPGLLENPYHIFACPLLPTPFLSIVGLRRGRQIVRGHAGKTAWDRWGEMGRESKISCQKSAPQIGRSVNLGRNRKKWEWTGKYRPAFPAKVPGAPSKVTLSSTTGLNSPCCFRILPAKCDGPARSRCKRGGGKWMACRIPNEPRAVAFVLRIKRPQRLHFSEG